MKNLRVAVIPTETGNGIDQSSSVEEILNCDELQLYPLTDYFKAQNDEEIDLLHWSFLIDIEKEEDLTKTQTVMNLKVLMDKVDKHTITHNIELIEMLIKSNDLTIAHCKNLIESIHQSRYTFIKIDEGLQATKRIKELKKDNEQLCGLLDMWQQVNKEKKVR